jgi:hypothetical protein
MEQLNDQNKGPILEEAEAGQHLEVQSREEMELKFNIGFLYIIPDFR